MNTNTHTNGHNGTAVTVRGPKKKTEQPKEIEIFSIEKQTIAMTLVGESPLIVNNFNEKSITQMEDLRRLDAEGKRAQKKAPRPPVIPEERYMAARILDENGADCVYARWIKSALVTAATKYHEIGVSGQQVRGVLFVEGDLLPIKFKGMKKAPAAMAPYLPDTPIGPCGLPNMRRDVVRVGPFRAKVPDLRYRPEYRDWSIDIRITFEPSLISLVGLHQLIRRAGASVGLCEWRPEKSPAGTFGRFDIAMVNAKGRAS